MAAPPISGDPPRLGVFVVVAAEKLVWSGIVIQQDLVLIPALCNRRLRTQHYHSPGVIKQLPDRFHGLAGKTIVIDGTLITQRFHFAQAPHPYRHILGWFRLVKEMKDCGVSTICVFDGKERNLAKAREAERRKEVQRLDAARGSLENDRSKRLRKLSSALHRFRNLDIITQKRATNLLRQLCSESDTSLWSSAQALLSSASENLESASDGNNHGLPFENDISLPENFIDRASEYVSEDERDALHAILENGQPTVSLSTIVDPERISQPLQADGESDVGDDTKLTSSCAPTTEKFSVSMDNSALPPTEQPLPESENTDNYDDTLWHDAISTSVQRLSDVQSTRTAPHITDIISSREDDDIPRTLASLYIGYRQSTSQLALLANPSNPSSTLPSRSLSEEDPDTRTDLVMSKAQYQLTLEEGNFWDGFAALSSTGTPDRTEGLLSQKSEATLIALANASNLMSESYQRRTNPPTSQTYDECREILQAMGVPCLDSTGAFEAEALASSMVLHGLADYVASEDTDVLIYGAPLVRNLTNRQSPLVVVSGADVRMVLQLDHTSFIDFALLLGTDFSQRIKNVGPARALKFIKEHRTIERIVEMETKFAPRTSPETYLAQVEIARMIFQTLPPVPEKRLLQQESSDEVQVMQLLQRYGLGRAAMMSDGWDYEAALDGNYFEDNPSAF